MNAVPVRSHCIFLSVGITVSGRKLGFQSAGVWT